MVFFETPAEATWGQVEIRFKDSHTVSVRVGDAHGVFHYAQMGMASRKNSKPTRQWDLLEAFAGGRGTLTWESSDASRKNQKRRELLAKDLRAFFRHLQGNGTAYAAASPGNRRHLAFEFAHVCPPAPPSRPLKDRLQPSPVPA
jgi:hypothetical protein